MENIYYWFRAMYYQKVKNIFFGSILFILFISYLFYEDLENKKQNALYFPNKVFKGKVVKKYIATENRNDKVLSVLNESGKITTICFFRTDSLFWNRVSIGDSLFKNKGEMKVIIKRDGEITVIDKISNQ